MKTFTGFDFACQPSLDKNRVLVLAGLQFINCAEAVHLIGSPQCALLDLRVLKIKRHDHPACAFTQLVPGQARPAIRPANRDSARPSLRAAVGEGGVYDCSDRNEGILKEGPRRGGSTTTRSSSHWRYR
ncbi:hypothetical protein [Bradyrhizobium sp. USDA 336]|uniref:hypothetical protein n=1 Tax=Bradyrhizobium sp. USDA 336 TaxID=3156311 RepID=UPI003833EE66